MVSNIRYHSIFGTLLGTQMCSYPCTLCILTSIYRQEEFDRLRHLAYRETDIFLLCFSVVSDASFHNLKSRWLPEVQHHSPDALLILVGLKCDLREDEEYLKKSNDGKPAVSAEQIEEYRKQSGAAAYVETSALKKINVEKAFETAIRFKIISTIAHIYITHIRIL